MRHWHMVEYRNENTKVILTKIMGGNKEESHYRAVLADTHSTTPSRITILRII